MDHPVRNVSQARIKNFTSMNIYEFLSQLRENQCKKMFDENGISSIESSLMNFNVTLMTYLKIFKCKCN
jgi:hypothetical protein